MSDMSEYYIFIGGSAGSLSPIIHILSNLPHNFCPPVTLVIHRSNQSDTSFIDHLSNSIALKVIEVIDKQKVTPRTIFISPCDYHLQIENHDAFSLCSDEKLHFCRPAIDILFSTAAEIYGEKCIAILCSGANEDGVIGLLKVKQLGGTAIAQCPKTAEFTIMPQSAITSGAADLICTPEEVVAFLQKLG